ncbi:hypothetical protein I5H27_gp058 [Mycobacterium phage DillTech15]|uniref:Uncharacterized protein n=1 Tax=Mycobacterium phage DillTech15 TaxID=2163591 RepID=A0A2S1PB26_9CAUD|nr:hypothetical protein I5H27_gp058 [Mycobacterium phage DillTech15]AWH13760.1 hypothetical protein SEA_DILLTECH15_58 [Mycobacterium phage DillTech15]
MMCVCGHNRSWHRYSWDRFRARWDTGCDAATFDQGGRERCHCSEYRDKDEN